MNLNDIKNSDINHAIDEFIHSERDRIILKKRLIDGYTVMQISDYLYKELKLDISDRQLKNIIHKAQRILFECWDINNNN